MTVHLSSQPALPPLVEWRYTGSTPVYLSISYLRVRSLEAGRLPHLCIPPAMVPSLSQHQHLQNLLQPLCSGCWLSRCSRSGGGHFDLKKPPVPRILPTGNTGKRGFNEEPVRSSHPQPGLFYSLATSLQPRLSGSVSQRACWGTLRHKYSLWRREKTQNLKTRLSRL